MNLMIIANYILHIADMIFCVQLYSLFHFNQFTENVVLRILLPKLAFTTRNISEYTNIFNIDMIKVI